MNWVYVLTRGWKSLRQSSLTVLLFTGRKTEAGVCLQMDSRDPIFLPSWDKSKPPLWKLRELHRTDKGGERAAAAEEQSELPRTVPRGGHTGAGDHHPPQLRAGQAFAQRHAANPEIQVEIAGVTPAPGTGSLSLPAGVWRKATTVGSLCFPGVSPSIFI